MASGAVETREESYSTPRAYKPEGMPPPQKRLHREAKRKAEDKPDERLKSARRALSTIFAAVPRPQTPEPPSRTVPSAASASEVDAACSDKAKSCSSTAASQGRPAAPCLTSMVQSCMSAAGMRTRKMASDGPLPPRKSQSCPCKPHPLPNRGLGTAVPNA
ncbi:hypothetical protein CVIRNUC_001955 [Coccomyxa viridis]|uniref:Uncharacterized protein n=1 Tax=Coccomyxa viridis TaxID=1274662 RepID=A0AAV1HUD9_9CHLO|nr:hypothetical protein CVIRNUC_001955 [Coccomyxa viridis]